MSGVTSGSFKDNIAFQGGAISADSSSSSLLAVEYNHSRAEGNFGSCFIMFGNELRGIGESVRWGGGGILYKGLLEKPELCWRTIPTKTSAQY